MSARTRRSEFRASDRVPFVRPALPHHRKMRRAPDRFEALRDELGPYWLAWIAAYTALSAVAVVALALIVALAWG